MLQPTHQPYELFAFAKKHTISLERARDILALHGVDRQASDAAAVAIADIIGGVSAKI